jgi:hypothetical protein
MILPSYLQAPVLSRLQKKQQYPTILSFFFLTHGWARIVSKDTPYLDVRNPSPSGHDYWPPRLGCVVGGCLVPRIPPGGKWTRTVLVSQGSLAWNSIWMAYACRYPTGCHV